MIDDAVIEALVKIGNHKMIDDAVIEALVKIGNHKGTVKLCEPNIMQPQELQAWMLRRSLKALELFQNEWDRLQEDSRGELQEVDIPDEGTVRGDS